MADAPDRDKTGGQFGLRPADRYPPLFLEATRDLGVGNISELVRSGAGFHVLKVIEKKSADSAVTITTGLRVGEQVVTSGAERLRDGMKVSLSPGRG